MRWLCCFAAAVMAVSFGGCSKSSDPAPLADVTVPTDFVVHTSPAGFSIKTPPTWREASSEDHDMAMKIFSGDRTSSVTVQVGHGPPPPRDPNEVARYIKAGVADRIANVHIKSAQRIQVNGLESTRVEYDGSASGVSLYWQQIMVPKGNTTYVVTFGALAQNYEELAPTIGQIMASMRVTE